MKIVCDSCGAKYSIADEKVAGRVAKIRCKRCGSTIVVRGDQSSGPAGTQSETSEPVWYVAIDNDQRGPLTPGQISEMLSAGTIGWDAYVWREGFEDWKPAQEVSELVQEIMKGSVGPTESDPFDDGDGATIVKSASGFPAAQRAMLEASPQAAPQIASSAGIAASPASNFSVAGDLAASSNTPLASKASARSSTTDLFASSDPLESSSGPGISTNSDVIASPAAARPAASVAAANSPAMTGTRNENSVLFSLANLQALATASPQQSNQQPMSVAPRAPSVAPQSSFSQARSGIAGGDGSGLIDIRSLASVAPASGMSNPTPKRKVDDLLSIGTVNPALGALGAPVIIPEKKESGGNKGLIIAASILGVCVLAAAGVGVMLLNNNNRPNNNDAVAMVGTPQNPEIANTAPASPTPAATATPTPAPAPVAPAPSAPSENRAESESSRAERGRNRRSGGSSSGEPARPTEAAPTPAPAAEARPSSGRARGESLDDLLRNATGSGGGGAREAAPSSNLPDQPTQAEVRTAMGGVQGAVVACGNGQHGRAQVAVTFAGSTGRVSNAVVNGEFAGTPVGSCIARAVRGASVSRFSRETLVVNYPFML